MQTNVLVQSYSCYCCYRTVFTDQDRCSFVAFWLIFCWVKRSRLHWLPGSCEGKGLGTCYSAAYTRLEQQRFTISEVAADWHELMIPWRIMRPFIARDGEQLDPRCSTQTYHRPNQRTMPSPRSPWATAPLSVCHIVKHRVVPIASYTATGARSQNASREPGATGRKLLTRVAVFVLANERHTSYVVRRTERRSTTNKSTLRGYCWPARIDYINSQ